MRSDMWSQPWHVRKALLDGEEAARRQTSSTRDAAYWRHAYEELVRQTGRDLNDGLGRDPRSTKPG